MSEPERKVVRAACPHDCPDTCAMEVTVEACRELISLPMYPELREEQVAYVAEQVRGFLEQREPAARVRGS